MRVHTSNFRARGFTRSVDLSDLVALGKKHQLPVIDDVGSGQVIDLAPFGLPGEPLVSAGIAAGADLVLFSGDKLLGGPQAGVIAGKAGLIRAIESDPLMRAFRLDKMTLAALEATLRLYRDLEAARREVPVLRMLTTPLAVLRSRTEAVAARLRMVPGLSVEVQDDVAYVGGGSLPDVALPTAVIVIRADGLSEAELAARLRVGLPSVVGRVRDGQLWLDLRAVFEREEDTIVAAVRLAVAEGISRFDHDRLTGEAQRTQQGGQG
jgi:L-seryl-tRNA(Ser) seleniumtransferase